ATQALAAEGFDAAGNGLGDVTALTSFAISGEGSCRSNACGAAQPGTYSITGSVGGISGTAQLTVVSAVASIVVSPVQTTIVAGATQSYRAEGYDDADNDLGDVTAETSFAIDGVGTCDVNMCGAARPGTYVVRGSYGAISGTVELVVQPGPLARLALSPTVA